MNNAEVDQLIARIERLPDEEVIKALASPDDYTLEARMIYEAEAKRRGFHPEIVRPVALQESQRRKNQLGATWSFKGIGEKLYGRRSFRADDSFQTTKWFVFLYLPIYPICSLRIKPDNQRSGAVQKVLPIDWRQAVDTYCFVVFAWGGIAILGRLIERHPFPYCDLVQIALLGFPFLFLYVVRLRARNSDLGEK